jgi:hypothetical protein
MRSVVVLLLLCATVCLGAPSLRSSTFDSQRKLEEKLALAEAIGQKHLDLNGAPKVPVLLIPGIGGTQLEQKFVNSTAPHSFCVSNSPWSRVWLKCK